MNINKISGVNGIIKTKKVESAKGLNETGKVQSKRDELQLSKEALDFQTVLKSVKVINSLPDVREDVIAPIKERLDKDSYSIDSKSIAEKLLGSKFNRKV